MKSELTSSQKKVFKERTVPAWVVMEAVEKAIGAENVVGLEARGDGHFAVMTGGNK